MDASDRSNVNEHFRYRVSTLPKKCFELRIEENIRIAHNRSNPCLKKIYNNKQHIKKRFKLTDGKQVNCLSLINLSLQCERFEIYYMRFQ